VATCRRVACRPTTCCICWSLNYVDSASCFIDRILGHVLCSSSCRIFRYPEWGLSWLCSVLPRARRRCVLNRPRMTVISLSINKYLETPLFINGHRPYINTEGQNCCVCSVKFTQMCVCVCVCVCVWCISNINEQGKTYPFVGFVNNRK